MAADALYLLAARRWTLGAVAAREPGADARPPGAPDLVDRDGWRTSHGLALLGWGAAVYLYFDVAGCGLVFDLVGSGVEIPSGGLRFDPVHRLEGPEGGSLGFIYRFAPGTSREG